MRISARMLLGGLALSAAAVHGGVAARIDVCEAPAATSWMWAPEGVPDNLCAGVRNSHRCAQAIESHALALAADGVLRVDGGLRIDVPRGHAVVFENGDTERGPFYLYLTHLPSGHHVVFKQLDEGSVHVLVDEVTGAVSSIPGRPILSPSGDRLAAVESTYENDRLWVFQRTGETWTFKWRYRLDGTGTRIAWESDARLLVCQTDHESRVDRLDAVVSGEDGWSWAVGPTGGSDGVPQEP